MRESIIEVLICPQCGKRGWSLQVNHRNAYEITDGLLTCSHCDCHFEIEKGVVNLLDAPSVTVVSEIKGWQKFHTPERNPEQFRDEWLRSLPRLDSKVSNDAASVQAWNSHGDNFDLALTQLSITGKERILEIGAGRCWATAVFARHGCCVIALDVVRTKYIGLESGEVFLDQAVYFDRVQSDMAKLPFAEGSFDIVFSTATVHHSPDLNEVFSEVARVLKRGGRFVAINDTVAGLFDGELDLEEISLGINEHAYSIFSYKNAMKSVGLAPRIYLPASWRRQLDEGKREMRSPMKKMCFRLTCWCWHWRVLRVLLEWILVNWAQLLWGIGLQAIAEKR
jgi:SAM-dependent methyltransferase/uncharacterized protein YbaR (Trm112 family)